ncbi:MAG: rubredoxin [Magnetococcales bacterium]|nr:rubredoxin [Magnetococcales bacterium]
MVDPQQYECNVCSWIYNENLGDPDGGIKPGTRWQDIPDDWECPVCGVGKDNFTVIIKKVASEVASDEFYLAQWERQSDEREGDFRSILQKAITGKESISPMRTGKWQNPLEDIVFLPGQLARPPIDFRDLKPSLAVTIGPKARKPLKLDLPFYVSDMSFGSLSKEAKIALAKGSAAMGTAIFGGEGGLLEEEYQAAKAYVFEYSTGRFGVSDENLKRSHAIQIKVGQAAKAGLGGHLLAEKVTAEIAAARGVPPGQEIISPANHRDILTKEDLKKRVDMLREVGEGVPVGVKIVAGRIEADISVAIDAGVDFITIDCHGGGTGAAPDHIKDNVCIPLPHALIRAKKVLVSRGKEDDVSLLVTGGVRTSADIAKALALGADSVGLATTAMIGIGCQQYRVCHKGKCPVGIATQDPELRARFDVDKSAALLINLFHVYADELADFIRICGKSRVEDLSQDDLCALTLEAAAAGICFAGHSQ